MHGTWKGVKAARAPPLKAAPPLRPESATGAGRRPAAAAGLAAMLVDCKGPKTTDADENQLVAAVCKEGSESPGPEPARLPPLPEHHARPRPSPSPSSSPPRNGQQVERRKNILMTDAWNSALEAADAGEPDHVFRSLDCRQQGVVFEGVGAALSLLAHSIYPAARHHFHQASKDLGK